MPACHPKAVEAPYAVGQAPSSEVLLAAAAPRISALQVSSAKVRIGRSPAANLMFLAQKPVRFSGQVQIAGRELVSLAFHEQGYALRNVAAEGLPTGFYAGPPADCAIRQLIGVPFSATELIDLVLGGSPRIAGPVQVVEQRWDRHAGHEVIRLRTPAAEQELRFAWVSGAWWVAGSTLWTRKPGGELTRLWSLLHEDLRPVASTVLPASTQISRPDGRKEQKRVDQRTARRCRTRTSGTQAPVPRPTTMAGKMRTPPPRTATTEPRSRRRPPLLPRPRRSPRSSCSTAPA